MSPSISPSFSPDGLSTRMPSSVIVELSRSDASTYRNQGRGRSIWRFLPSTPREQESDPLRYALQMDTSARAATAPASTLRERSDIPARFKWNLKHIFEDWPAWQGAYDTLDRKIAEYAALQGTLARGADELLRAMRLSDDIGQLTYKVWYYASLMHDEDQRDN